MLSMFEQLQKDGKILAAEGRLLESLQKFEQARKIKETPKILQRIQKLKDFMALNGCDENEDESAHSSSKDDQVSKTPKDDHGKERRHTDRTPSSAKVLNQIQNIKNLKEQSFKKLSETKSLAEEIKTSKPPSPDKPDLEQFEELKKKAMSLSYVGKFEDSIEIFKKAWEIYPCPKVKEYIEQMKAMAAQHAEKLHRVQSLTSSVKKLVKEGNHKESLKTLKNAYAVCPSPSISSMIKKLETPNRLKHSAELSDSFGAEKSSADSKKKSSETVFTFPKPVDSFRSEKISENSKDLMGVGSSTSSTGELSALSPQKLSRYKQLYQKAKDDAGEGKLEAALKTLLEAKSICATDKICKRLADLQSHIKNLDESGDGDNNMIEVTDDFYLFHEVYKKMYPYQREGVAWMWRLFQKRKGGILGDDMGLGKTFQVIAFLSGLIDADKVKHVLIIMPVSLLPNWEKEFKKWCPGIVVNTFHTGTKREKERKVLRVQRKGHVLLTSYGMTLGNQNYLTQCEGREFIWDYVILDEGHKIKNPTKTTKAVYEIPSRNRLVLTGTPIQNNLAELWALFDFAHQGTLLGSMKTFKLTYENTITRAREKDATAGEKRLGTEMADNLKKLISPYFLRRTKAEVFSAIKTTDLEDGIKNLSIQENKLARKNDLIMWVYLSETQCEIYNNFLHSDAVKTILLSKRSPLVELTILKKICDHPRLLSLRACLQLGLNGQKSDEDLMRALEDESSNSASISNVSDETLIEESGKLKFLIQLLEELRGNGHRTLVFSLSRKILDMVHRILVNRNWKVLRIDGTISKMDERERRIQLFQKDPSYSVFLLTTQVGGVGITLTAADRVIIYDPSWNPATDAQAVDRVYRIGQKKNVVVYRLITCGSVEEKIYRRQVFKDSITRQATGAADPYRYFSKQELRELFTLDNPRHSATQAQLHKMHSNERQSDSALNDHIAYLHSLNIFGISDHDLMFSKNIGDQSEDNDGAAVCHNYIKQQVTMAQARIQDEAAVVEEGITISGCFARPYPSVVQTFKKNSIKDNYVPPTFPETTSTFSASSNIKQSHFNQDVKDFDLDRHQMKESVKVDEKVKNWLTGIEKNSKRNSASFGSDEEYFTPLQELSTQKEQSTRSESNKQQPDANVAPNDKNSLENSVFILDNSEEINAKNTSSPCDQISNAKNSPDHVSEHKSFTKSKSSVQDSFPSDDLNKNSEIFDARSDAKENLSPKDSPSNKISQNLNSTNSNDADLTSEGKAFTKYRSSEINASAADSSAELESLFGDVGLTSTPLKNSVIKDHSNSLLLKDLSFDEQPLLKRKSFRKSCAKKQDIGFDSDASSSVHGSEVEIELDSEGEMATENEIASEYEDRVATENEDEIASENEDRVTTENEDEVVSEKEDRVATENEDEVASENEDRVATENEEELASEYEDRVTTEDEDELASRNREALIPETDDELVPVTDDELVPETDDELPLDNLNESNASCFKSEILDSPSIVPSSIPNSPFLNRSASVSKRITALRLQRSNVSSDSPFAKAMAVSPVIDIAQFEKLGVSNTSIESSPEINSPLISKKKKAAVIYDSEDEY